MSGEYILDAIANPKKYIEERKKQLGMGEAVCEHHNWVPAGYPQNGTIRVQSIYEVYCHDCKHFIYLLDGTIIDDKGLIWPNQSE